MNKMNIIYYFNLWKNFTEKRKMFRDYDEWCKINQEKIDEEEFARENGIDSIDWCWNCKYSECDIH